MITVDGYEDILEKDLLHKKNIITTNLHIIAKGHGAIVNSLLIRAIITTKVTYFGFQLYFTSNDHKS